MLFHANINLNKNELQNARAHNLAAAPSSPGDGQLYFNTADDNLYVWDGTGWVDLTVQGGGISYGTPSATINAGDAAVAGVSADVLRADAQFAVATAAALAITGANAEGTSVSLARADHDHAIAAGTITDTHVAAANKDGVAGTASLRTLGTGAQQAAAGNHTHGQLHNQNSDVGTSSTTFYLVGSAATDVAIKKESNGVLAVRLGNDSAYADLKVDDLTVGGNLTVQGTTTTVDSETLTVADNEIELNSNVATAAASTEDAGVAIRRYAGADVAQFARVKWNETNEWWALVFPASTGTATVEKQAARKHVTLLGAITGGTPIVVTHNLNTRAVVVEVRDTATHELVMVDKEAASVDTVELTFANSAAANAFEATIIG